MHRLIKVDRDLVIEALEAAHVILSEHIEPGGPPPEVTINRLLSVLDTDELLMALERLKAGYGLRVVKWSGRRRSRSARCGVRASAG